VSAGRSIVALRLGCGKEEGYEVSGRCTEEAACFFDSQEIYILDISYNYLRKY